MDKHFCFASYIKLLKKHCSEETISNEQIIGNIFSSVCPNDVKKDFYSKSDVSQLINRKQDVPRRITNELINGKFDIVHNNILDCYDCLKDVDQLISQLNEVYLNDSLISKPKKEKLINIKLSTREMLTYFLIESAKIENNIYNVFYPIYKKGRNRINYTFTDLINLGFAKKSINIPKIIVVPVDDKFTMHLSDFGDIPFLVSKNTIHGEWLKKMYENGYDENTLNKLIKEDRNISNDNVITILYHKIKFYLLPCSFFNETYMAYSSKEIIEKAIKDLLDFYNKDGQGYELYIPLIGTGSSRANLSNKESFNLIKDTISKNKEKLNGIINIAIFIKDHDEMDEYIL